MTAWPDARSLWRVGAGTTLVVLALSVVNPVLAVALQRRGVSTGAIGLFAMLPFLTVALMIPAMPRVFARVGVIRAYRGGLVLGLLSLVGYALTDSYGAWCLWSVVGALGAAAEWNGTEALIAFNAPPDQRGRFTGLYQTGLGAALALGPLVPGAAQWLLAPGRAVSTVWLLWGAALVYGLALVVTAQPAVGRLRASQVGAVKDSLRAALRARPALVWIAFSGGVFEAGLGGITAAFGSQLGMSLGVATSIAGALGIGSFALQYPAGWLADHAPVRRVFTVAGVLLLVSVLAFGLAPRFAALFWIAAFLWGAVGGALYTLTMIRVAHDFTGRSTIAGTAAMITGYTAGGATGPAVSGLMLERFGVPGQAMWLGLLAVSVVVVALRMPAGPGRP
ncbi:MFS transporter [Methylibium sp.]|uniref:MFS transporter n=1 Tax=Methylibium sp. TaxID=2067992 RepID=UPI003D1519AB